MGKLYSRPIKGEISCYRRNIRWIEVTNETMESSDAVKAICEALALISITPSHPKRI